MSATALITAVDAAIALTQFAMRLTEAANQINLLINTAQAQNRDLSYDEIKQIEQLRNDAMNRWASMAPGV